MEFMSILKRREEEEEREKEMRRVRGENTKWVEEEKNPTKMGRDIL